MNSEFVLDQGQAVQLPVWQAPNDFVQMQFERDKTKILFKIWKKDCTYSKFLGVLVFEKTWAFRMTQNKELAYYNNEEEHDFKSYYLVVKNSSWLNSLKEERSKESNDWRKYDASNYQHNIIQSHSFYIEVISKPPIFSKIISTFCNCSVP